MQRTISAMVGKGSVNHNSRLFHAENTDISRTHLNITYCNEDIKSVYHQLFDDALRQYNDRQTRSKRKIEDYYQKIVRSSQEKTFHELIMQIGDKDNMGATSQTGERSAAILDQYMKKFQERNPNLYVFSAHLHMDEATPHLHIDFVPYTTESKRGLDTRVSLKQALATQGFKGGTRGATEWNQWVRAEKEALSQVMLEHGIQWEEKGTHEKHLTVVEFKKQERIRELEALTAEVEMMTTRLEAVDKVEVKPTLLDKSKVTVDKNEFEDVKRLAKKHIVSKKVEVALIAENSELKIENRTLREENTALRSLGERLKFTQLKQDYERLKKKLDRVMDFIDRLGLREKLNQFLQPTRKRGQEHER